MTKRTGPCPRCNDPITTREGYCRPCRNAYRRERYANSKKAKRQVRLDAWKRQGIELTWDEYTALLEDQSHVCAICMGPPPTGQSLHVDHNHETGTVRALLCTNCNLALGSAREDPALLLRMADYLEQHQPLATQGLTS